MPNLNKTFVGNQKEPGEFRDDSLRGFVLDVSMHGVKSYKVNARIKGGKVVTYVIGKHGEPWNATTARQEAADILHAMKKGFDPREIRKEQKAVLTAQDDQDSFEKFCRELTVRKAFHEWCTDSQKTKESTKKLYRYVLEKHLEDWLDKPMNEITAEMVSKRYAELVRKTVASANNAFRALRRLFNWTADHYEEQLVEAPLRNPVTTLAKRDKWESNKSRNDQYIADQDLEPWLKAVLSVNNRHMRDYFIFLLLTGLRKNEAASLRWQDVDFKRGRFTVMDTKNRSDHTLPLTDLTRALLKGREDSTTNFVFPGDGVRGHIGHIEYYQQKIIEASGVRFTPHMLRRTFSYAAERVRLGDSERKKLLNHMRKSDVTDSHYSPKEIDDLREPLKEVEQFILNKAGNDLTSIFLTKQTNIIHLRKARH